MCQTCLRPVIHLLPGRLWLSAALITVLFTASLQWRNLALMTTDELSESFINAANVVTRQLLDGVVSPMDVELLILLIHGSKSANNSYVLALVSVLDRLVQSPDYYLIDPDMYVIKLYEAVLVNVPLSQVLDMYPIELIIENIKYGNQFTLLIIKILTIHAGAEIMLKHDLLFQILHLYLTNADLLISISSQIQILLLQLSNAQLNILNQEPFQQLFTQTKNSHDSTLISRLLDLIALVYPVVNFDVSFEFGDDILLNLLIINYYEKMVLKGNRLILQEISSDLQRIFALYKTRLTDPEVEMILATDIVVLTACLSYRFPDYPIELLNMNDLSLDNASDVKLFSRINPEIIPLPVLQELCEFSLFSSKFFTILLNLISKEATFNYLSSSKVLTPDKVKNLLADNLFELLIVLTQSEYGVSYLLNELPNIVSDHLISDNIFNSDLYNLKLQVMENLVLKNHNLYIWEDQLIEAYKVMKNGKNIRHEARVAIADETV